MFPGSFHLPSLLWLVSHVISWLPPVVRAVCFLNLGLCQLFLPAIAFESWPHPGLNCLVYRFASIVSSSSVLHMHVHTGCMQRINVVLVSGCSFITSIYIWVQNRSACTLRAKSLPQIVSNSPWCRTRNVHCLVWPRFRQYSEAIKISIFFLGKVQFNIFVINISVLVNKLLPSKHPLSLTSVDVLRWCLI